VKPHRVTVETGLVDGNGEPIVRGGWMLEVVAVGLRVGFRGQTVAAVIAFDDGSLEYVDLADYVRKIWHELKAPAPPTCSPSFTREMYE